MEQEESLVERIKRLRMLDVDEVDDASVERAIQAKQTLAERMKAAQGGQEVVLPSGPPARLKTASADLFDDDDEGEVRTFTERLKHLADRKGVQLEQETGPIVPKTRQEKFTDWFLGREIQERSRDAITPIPHVPEGWRELEFQEVRPPYSYSRIRENIKTGSKLYEVIEPPLNEKETEILGFVHDALVRGLNVDPTQMERIDREEILNRAVRQIIRDYRIRLTDVSQRRLQYYIIRDFIGLGQIEVVMIDAAIEDVSCDGPGQGLFVYHRDYESIPCSIEFATEGDIDGFVIRLAQRSGKAISISDPMLDAALPDGSRLQATLGKEVTHNGSTFTIRRFKPDPFTPIDLINFGTMSRELLAYFWLVVENHSSMMMAGGTASGKTTTLNAISQFIPPQSKIVSIEDTREVNLPHKNWIKAVTRTGSNAEGTGEIGMFELLKASLRQRPEYILVGEVRGEEASVAFQAMATGHAVYSTMHADSARSVVYRLENAPIDIPRLVLQALDVIGIQAQVRLSGQRVRRLTEVVELVGMDPHTRELLTHTAFRWDPVEDKFTYAGRSYLLERIATNRNWSAAQLKKVMAERVKVIRWLIDGGIDKMSDVTAVIEAYYRSPKDMMKRVAQGPPERQEAKELVA